jgi:hypothetical protein
MKFEDDLKTRCNKLRIRSLKVSLVEPHDIIDGLCVGMPPLAIESTTLAMKMSWTENYNFSNLGCLFCRPLNIALSVSVLCSIPMFHTAV